MMTNNNRSASGKTRGKTTGKNGLTLLEILLALALMIVLFGLLWGLVRVYSGHYLAAENKASRSQLVRALADMLEGDLASAIQDPIHPLTAQNESGGRYIRRFGLLGTATSLQIDVVEPDLFVPTASVDENRQALLGQGKPAHPQVPELKTIFYEFVPPGAVEKTEEEFGLMPDESDSAISGSKFVGSLQSLPTPSVPGENALPGGMEDQKPLVRKFGLSRRELDFETPGEAEEPEVNAGLDIDSDIVGGSKLVGSLAAPPDMARSELHSDAPGSVDSTPLEELLPEEIYPYSAAQLAVATEEQTRWAPEVIDCRFRYFDGSTWFDSWNSITQNGLPVAIEVQLRLLPLDEVDVLRASPELRQWANNLQGSNFQTLNTSLEQGSQIVGTLQTQPDGAFLPMTEQTSPATLDSLIENLGLSRPMDRRVVAWLPTTPLSAHHLLERRKPALVSESGPESSWRTESAGGGTGDRPTFSPRKVKERTPKQRQAKERTAVSRTNPARQTSSPAASTRQARTAKSGSRTAKQRVQPDRVLSERTPNVETVLPPVEKPDFAIIDEQMSQFPSSSPAVTVEPGSGGVDQVSAQTSRSASAAPAGGWIRGGASSTNSRRSAPGP